MDNWFLLYLVTRLDALQALFAVPGIIGGGAAVVTGAFHCLQRAEEGPDNSWAVMWRTAARQSLWIAVICLPIACVIPNKNDVFFIVGGATLIEATKTDTAKRIGSKSLEAVERWLDENMSKEPAKP